MANNTINHVKDDAQYVKFNPVNDWPQSITNVQAALAAINGFAVTGLPDATEDTAGIAAIATQEEVNDGTVEGLRHKKYPAFSVQFHPDATPGPHDEVSLFDDFMSMIDQRKEEERHA